jgi:hypothetical protein
MGIDYLEAVSSTIGLGISDENRAGVIENLDRIATIAEFLMRFPLSQDVEVAPVFRP